MPDGARTTDRSQLYKTVSFQSSLTVQICVTVILDDIACERVESIIVTLESGSAVCHGVEYQVMIEDSTCECIIIATVYLHEMGFLA